MSNKKVIIRVKNNNRKVHILSPVKDSLHSSLLSDRIDKLPYLKVFERIYYAKSNYCLIKCNTIPALFTIEKLHDDLDKMSDLILLESNETK